PCGTPWATETSRARTRSPPSSRSSWRAGVTATTTRLGDGRRPRGSVSGVNSRRSWVVFGIGVFAYLIGVMQRTTIGVAGVEAADRFHVSASVLSTLAVVQVVVYALMQVPVGALIDRVGPRRLILTGTLLMAIGQFVVAFSPVILSAV